MIFKDRREAGTKLLLRLLAVPQLKKNWKHIIVVSLIRGGIVVGDVIAKGLEVKHLPLVVSKIPAPYNPELALGALCFAVNYLEKSVVDSLRLERVQIENQIEIAREKFNSYLKRFHLRETLYSKGLKNKIVVLTDDGIATGSTIRAAILYLRSKKTKSIILAVPVAPTDFSASGVDKEVFLHKNFSFGAVSQFYEHFPQIEDDDVKKVLRR